MSQDVINENTDENIKNYLSENDEINRTEDDKWSDVSGGGKNKNNSKKKRKLIFTVLFLVVAIISAVACFMYLKGQQSFDSKEVKIEIKVSDEISSGEEIVFTIEYKNNTGVKLKNPKVILFTPEKFVFISSDKKYTKEGLVLNWDLDDLLAGESGKIKLFGRVVGNKDSEHEFNSKISYVPSNFNYEFQSADNLSKVKIKITSVSFELSLKCPEEIITGNEIDCLIAYENTSDNDFKKINIKVDFPDGFAFISAEPEIDEEIGNNLSWSIKEIKTKAKGELVIKGNLAGEKNEEKEIRITMDIFGDEEDALEYISKKAIIKVQDTPILLKQTANGLENISVNKGEEIEYRIKFKNIGDRELKGLVINNELTGSVDLDFIEVINGSYDKESNKIIWSAFNVPKLAVFKPGDEGEVSFKIRAIDYFEVKLPEDKNFVIKNKVTISSFNFNNSEVKIEKEIVSNEMIVKINAFLFMKTKGYFNDDGRIKNIGVIPPEVGEKTTYTIHWNLNNLLGDLKNVKIVSVLPENVNWTGNYINSNGDISLGDESNGTYTSKIVDPIAINNINGGMGNGGLGVGYNWYDETVYKDINHKGLPEELRVGDTLEFIYNDGNIEQIGYCVIGTVPGNGEGHSFYCTVPWEVSLPHYAGKENYKIKKVMPITSEERFYYNTVTREIVWEIPELLANTGLISPSKEIVYQINIIPEDADVGKTIKIMNEVKAAGFDEFTNEEVMTLESELTTELPDDYSIGMEEGIVVDG